MNKRMFCRCTLFLALALGALPALAQFAPQAQWRDFPDDAKRAKLSPSTKYNTMLLDNKEILTTPGLQIRNQNNVIIFPSMVKKDSAVLYDLEGARLHRAWILTPQEIAYLDRGKKPEKPAKPAILPAKLADKAKDSSLTTLDD